MIRAVIAAALIAGSASAQDDPLDRLAYAVGYAIEAQFSCYPDIDLAGHFWPFVEAEMGGEAKIVLNGNAPHGAARFAGSDAFQADDPSTRCQTAMAQFGCGSAPEFELLRWNPRANDAAVFCDAGLVDPAQ